MPTSAEIPVCPWCSAELKSSEDVLCPSCGAVLRDPAAEGELPGVTRVDHEGIMRSRAPAQRSRGLMGWLSRDEEVKAPEPPETFAPPDPEVRREMLRMQMAALEARLLAERAEQKLARVAKESASNATAPEGDEATEPGNGDDPAAEAAAMTDDPGDEESAAPEADSRS